MLRAASQRSEPFLRALACFRIQIWEINMPKQLRTFGPNSALDVCLILFFFVARQDVFFFVRCLKNWYALGNGFTVDHVKYYVIFWQLAFF